MSYLIDFEPLLKTEYSKKFDEIRKGLVLQSYYKYGKASRNFVSGNVDAIGSLKKCIAKFEETGNLEYLADAANYCMFRYMFPQGKEFFKHTDSGESAGIDGMSVKEIEEFKKHSPEILVVTGIVGAVASAVMACKATTKLSDITEEAKEKIDDIHADIENGTQTEEDSKKELTVTYAQTAVKIAKLYAPSVILGGLSIGAILTSNNMLRKRNVALAAAYTAIDKSFKEYRGRVVDRFGEELDRELKYNIRKEQVEETVTDENGETKTVTKEIEVVDPDNIAGYSPYAKFYEDGCIGWTKDPEFNLMFLRRQQDAANDRLRDKGFLFLNEVYDMLGIYRTKIGQQVGWVYDKNNEYKVDFGIYNIHRPENRAFVNGYERTILLDFNVDGDILDMM